MKLHFTLLRRYGANLKWPTYMVTEASSDKTIQALRTEFDVKILEIPESERFFLESRLAACRRLPVEIKYIFPMQEDFLLGSRIDELAIEEALRSMDEDTRVLSVRLMPCPGPKSTAGKYKQTNYRILDDDFLFTYQATLWRRDAYELFMASLLDIPEGLFLDRYPGAPTDEAKIKKFIQVDFNLAENSFGQKKMQEIFPEGIHLAWPRAHPHANAVFLCPWPYRPTAVEKGKLGSWVNEFAKREGVPIETA